MDFVAVVSTPATDFLSREPLDAALAIGLVPFPGECLPIRREASPGTGSFGSPLGTAEDFEAALAHLRPSTVAHLPAILVSPEDA